MDKKEIYEHLAKIYLDASSKRKKKSAKPHKVFKNIIFISIILVPAAILFIHFFKNKPLNSQVMLVLCPEAVKINFNFDPAKKEIYSLDLAKLDLRRFKALGFSVKKTYNKDNIALRVEFTSRFKEKSEVYFKDIPHRWQDYQVNLSEFKNIKNWSQMLTLSFIIEEWNVKEKQGVVYIDNVRLLR